MKTICFIKTADSSFILVDQQILEKQFHLIPYLIRKKKTGIGFIVAMLRLIIFLLISSRHIDAYVTWFADYHAAIVAFLGRILGKKVIIFLGGQEAICYPELNKGVYLKKIRGSCVKYAIQNADHLIPNHESLIWHKNFYYQDAGKIDGIKHYIPDFNTACTIIPNGTDIRKYFRDSGIPKNTSGVLTVGTMNNLNDFINKGFDLFAELAQRNPDYNFTMAGINPELLRKIEIKYHLKEIRNLNVILFTGYHELFHLYNRANVFVQASITEGMPNTLAEAMLCECVPVGSRVNGIPDLIGDTGIIVDKRDINILESCVHKALKLNSGIRAAERIRTKYSYEIREKLIHRLFKEIV